MYHEASEQAGAFIIARSSIVPIEKSTETNELREK